MFRCLFAIALIAAPASAETAWWRTAGAAVMQLTPHDCSLISYDNDQAVIVNWNADGSQSLAVQDLRAQYDDMQFAALVAISGKPLEGNLIGIGEGSIVTIALPQSIDTKLRDAPMVLVHIANVQVNQLFEFTLPTQKMPALLAAVSKCRAVIK